MENNGFYIWWTLFSICLHSQFLGTIHQNHNHCFIPTNSEIIVISVSFTNILNYDPSLCFVILLHFYQRFAKNNFFLLLGFPCFTFISGFIAIAQSGIILLWKKFSQIVLKTFRIINQCNLSILCVCYVLHKAKMLFSFFLYFAGIQLI
jgi:hypothetical protein